MKAAPDIWRKSPPKMQPPPPPTQLLPNVSPIADYKNPPRIHNDVIFQETMLFDLDLVPRDSGNSNVETQLVIPKYHRRLTPTKRALVAKKRAAAKARCRQSKYKTPPKSTKAPVSSLLRAPTKEWTLKFMKVERKDDVTPKEDIFKNVPIINKTSIPVTPITTIVKPSLDLKRHALSGKMLFDSIRELPIQESTTAGLYAPCEANVMYINDFQRNKMPKRRRIIAPAPVAATYTTVDVPLSPSSNEVPFECNLSPIADSPSKEIPFECQLSPIATTINDVSMDDEIGRAHV